MKTRTRRYERAISSVEIAVVLELLHHPYEVSLARRGVDGGGLEPLMAQERGDAHQVGPRIERVLAEAMAEGMGGDVLEASQASVLGDQQLDGPGADALPTLADEELLGRDRGAHLQIG